MIRFILSFWVALAATLPARAEIAIQEVTSPGGITAWLVEEHGLPFTALEIRFKGGTALDAPGKRGAVNLMMGLIEEGAGERSAMEFALARESLAASYGFDAYPDAVSVSARFLSENRDEAVALLREALVSPRFDEDAIERVRRQVLSGLAQRATDPADIASETFNRLAYGDHPYGSHDGGTAESVRALGRDDIVAAHHAVMARDRAYVAAVGDITANELGAILDQLLGGLPDTGAPMPGRAAFGLDGGITVVPFDTPQSVAIFGHEGIAFEDPDFFAAYVVNEVFGAGGLTSRLMDEVREKRGLTYGVYTYLATRDHAETVQGNVRSANATMAEAIEVIRAEWARLAAEGVSEDELRRAKTYMTGAYPLRFDGNERIASILAGMQMDGFPIDYAATRNERVEAVTLEDANRVAARVFRPEALHFVVVGRPEGVETGK